MSSLLIPPEQVLPPTSPHAWPHMWVINIWRVRLVWGMQSVNQRAPSPPLLWAVR